MSPTLANIDPIFTVEVERVARSVARSLYYEVYPDQPKVPLSEFGVSDQRPYELVRGHLSARGKLRFFRVWLPNLHRG